MTQKKFYDIHFHSMDLSHANITAFLSRFLNDNGDIIPEEKIETILKDVLPIWKKLFLPLVPNRTIAKKIYKGVEDFIDEKKLDDKLSKARNLLTFMESAIKYDFLIIEHFLKKDQTVGENNELKIGSQTFSKIVLCPLIMDFGYKNINNPDIYYNIPPQKPITAQIRDLLKAIETYYRYDLTIREKNGQIKFDVQETDTPREKRLFEIYPFMGINTSNYDYDKIKEMLDKYFGHFSSNDSPEKRQQMLFDKMGRFDGDLDNEEDCKNIFAGIKLYPPLGFNPLPDACPHCQNDNEDCKCEKAKVKLLYRVCTEKNIPITTHCSTGGFTADDHAKDNTCPGTKWAGALQLYPDLKVNFAHFGSNNPEWEKEIIENIIQSENVYADFSYLGKDKKYYTKLSMTIKKHDPKLTERIIFGSDFMINLLEMKSYNEYLGYYIETGNLTDELKTKFANENSERFLFGH